MKKIIFLLAVALYSGIGFSYSQGGYATVEGTKQGKFGGEGGFGKKNADKIEVLGFTFEIKSPRDVASGMATGRKMYQPITIYKLSGSTSPSFMNALINNELLSRVTIDFIKPDPAFAGQEVVGYSITLENASISGFRQFMGPLPGEKFTGPGNKLLYDEISIVFERIMVVDKPTNKAAADTWSTRF